MSKQLVTYLSKREAELIKYGRSLDPNSRHRVTIIYRGREPWEIEEHIVQKKIELISKIKHSLM